MNTLFNLHSNISIALPIFLPIYLTVAHLLWIYYWAKTYTRIRRARAYASGRTLADTNKRYKFIGYLSFFTHNFIALMAYWSDAPWIFKLYQNTTINLTGTAILAAGTILHAQAIKHLGDNYSPCFDSHLPGNLIQTGPYGLIRHPDYLAKLIVSFGLLLMTASLWALALFIWLAAEIARSIYLEEKTLNQSLPGYSQYQTQTKKLIPFIF